MPLPPPPNVPIPGLSTTANDIIRRALMMLGVSDKTSPLDALDAEDCLITLNRMLDTWAQDKVLVWSVPIADFQLIAGQALYRYGTGGDFNSPRPASIDAMSIVNQNNPALPAEIPISMFSIQEWQAIPVKNITSPMPLGCFDDESFPFRNLTFYPIPSINVPARIYSWQSLPFFPDLTTPLSFPPAYLEAIDYNLAVQVSALFPPAQPSAVIVARATATLSLLRTANTETTLLKLDSALSPVAGGYYNYITDNAK